MTGPDSAAPRHGARWRRDRPGAHGRRARCSQWRAARAVAGTNHDVAHLRAPGQPGEVVVVAWTRNRPCGVWGPEALGLAFRPRGRAPWNPSRTVIRPAFT